MNSTTETCDDHWLYDYDRSISIKSQVIYSTEKGSILNVSKIYTNNIYFGAAIFIFSDSQIHRLTKCKDRGFTEQLVDNKEYILNHKLFSNNAISASTYFQSSNIRTDIYDINLSPVVGHIPIFQLCFIGNDYICSNLIIGDSINRGLYNHEHNNDINNNLPSNTIPTIDNMNNFYKQTKIALSNVYTYVNTDYSQIKVYRKTI